MMSSTCYVRLLIVLGIGQIILQLMFLVLTLTHACGIYLHTQITQSQTHAIHIHNHTRQEARQI